MNRIKRCLLAVLLMLSVSACGIDDETIEGIIARAERHAEEKYDQDFIFVDYGKSWNEGTGLNMDIAFKDENETVFLVCGTNLDNDERDEFYDYYLEAVTSRKIENEIDTSAAASLYHYSVDCSLYDDESIPGDTGNGNIRMVIFRGVVEGRPSSECMKSLYDVYSQLSSREHESIWFDIGFVEEADDFTDVLDFYSIYGNSEWDYDSRVYSYLKVSENGLSFEEFTDMMTMIDS